MSTELSDARLLAALQRQEFASFVAGAMRVLVPGEPYLDNYHIHAICYELEQVYAGKWRRSVITCPPRHLKSIIASVCFPAWLLGHNPRARIVCISHTAELAVYHHNECRRLMASPYYRQLFPGTVLSREKNTETEFRTTLNGGRFSTSVGGPITGRGGGYVIMDDLMKADDVHSAVKREAVINWYGNTLYSRQDAPTRTAMVMVAQRLHEADIVGHILEQGGWHHLNLPAKAEVDERIQVGPDAFYLRRAGELLHPARIPQEALDGIAATMGAADFSAQYQQRPAPFEGAIIKRAWLQRYARSPERRPGDQLVQSWDMGEKAGQKNDFSVCVTFLKRGRQHYLLHVFRDRLEFPALRKKVVALQADFAPATILIEDAAAGTQILQQLKADPKLPSAIKIKPQGDKQARLNGQSAKFEAGDVFFPEEAPWLIELEAELLAFPKSRYDDQVDAISQYLAWADKPEEWTIRFGGEII